MTIDIFDFWKIVGLGEKVHPDDEEVLSQFKHRFELNCLPSCMTGPLRTASVVCLGLAPGWTKEDPLNATRESARLRNLRMRGGNEPLPGPDDFAPAWKWWSRRTKVFGQWQDLQTRLAFMNIVPYKSADSFTDWEAIRRLPSCRVTLEWARDVLFPKAIHGERIVICLRSAKQWGLVKGSKQGQLYAPEMTRGAHMIHGPMREEIIAVVRNAIAAHIKLGHSTRN